MERSTDMRQFLTSHILTDSKISHPHPDSIKIGAVYVNHFYDTSVIFSNSIITYREPFTICIGHDRQTDVIGIDCWPNITIGLWRDS